MTYLIEYWDNILDPTRDGYDITRPWLMARSCTCIECDKKNAGDTLYTLISKCMPVTNAKVL